jgi:hypothetical protein
MIDPTAHLFIAMDVGQLDAIEIFCIINRNLVFNDSPCIFQGNTLWWFLLSKNIDKLSKLGNQWLSRSCPFF